MSVQTASTLTAQSPESRPHEIPEHHHTNDNSTHGRGVEKALERLMVDHITHSLPQVHLGALSRICGAPCIESHPLGLRLRAKSFSL